MDSFLLAGDDFMPRLQITREGFALWQKKNTFANTTPTPFSRSGARVPGFADSKPVRTPTTAGQTKNQA
ncbi:MAG: hypothetical protein QG562_103 [Patescibacteria group bacterium]|nr:hypothetical protein [Patescibacteria group bacterium]MDQ5958285.1 hypothetical protein [Patescibacteria group bacterium]